MTREEAKEQIRHQATLYLTPDNQSQHLHGKPKGYVCPICGSGSGKKGTGITTRDGIHFTCWRGCYTSSDIIDIIGLQYGLVDYNAKFERACAEYGIDFTLLGDNNPAIEALRSVRICDSPNNDVNAPKIAFKKQGSINPKAINQNAFTGLSDPLKKKSDFTMIYAEWGNHRTESDYLTKRGISSTTQTLFSIGYCPDWRHPKSPRMQPSPRIIIPTSECSYLARYAGDDDYIDWKGRVANKSKVGTVHIFNLKAIEQGTQPIFVVEGEIDALSVAEVGYTALALGSTSNYGKLVDYTHDHRPTQPLIIALDGDRSGVETTQKLLSGLRSIGVECYIADINGGHKDANEHLIADREGFRHALEMAVKETKSAKEAARLDYLEQNNALACLDEWFDDSYIPTGFSLLDNSLDGGLYEGLYIIGAISSLGKTTLALQIADQVAKNGHDVLIFSLEMARKELVAKSLSRLTAELAIEQHKPISQAKTIREITVRRLYEEYTPEEKSLLEAAKDCYKQYATRVFIIEGMGNVGTAEIRQTVEKHIALTGNTPVVVVDYLQIISPHNERATDKQNTDRAVLELKRLSRDYKLPVIGISSFNRENYNSAVSMQAFKESGAIEYSSDVLIGLQLKGAGDKNFDVERAKKQDPRMVEAKVLKNRNGWMGTTRLFRYYPRYNLFQEATTQTEEYAPSLWDERPQEKAKVRTERRYSAGRGR